MKNFLKWMILLLVFSCSNSNEQNFENEPIIAQMKRNDQKMPEPQAGDWLSYNKETGQTFEQYKKAKPVMPTDEKKVIYVLPLGDFNEKEMELIQHSAEYLQMFFNLKTVRLQPIKDTIIPDSARRINAFGVEQLWASYILKPFLHNARPKDAIAFIAITKKDLYPEPAWNYVFGLAMNNLGVMSIHRLLENEDYTLCLERLIKVVSHEMGHMFSVKHCIHAICVMNGSNSMPETDTQPNRLCSECLKKLSWNLKFDNKKRLEKIRDFFEKHKLTKDYKLIQKDLR